MSAAIQPERLRKLLHRLIDIYSPSGKEEAIVDYLHGYLKRRGIAALRQPVGERRHNLIVLPAAGVELALVGHLDTVAAHDLDDYGYRLEGERVCGLGAADMKGGCAAMVEAFLALRESQAAPCPVGLVLVVGEEEEGDGAERLMEEYHFPWALIGEPTELKPCLSHSSYLEVQVCTSGRRKHASLANRTRSPVDAMLRHLLKISGHVSVRAPEVACNIRDLFTSRSGFAVPDRCEAWLDIHLPPEAPVGEVMVDLEEVLSQAGKQEAGVETSCRFHTVDAGYALPEKGLVVDSLKALHARRGLSWEPQTFRSHSDANRLWAAGVKPILLGPGELEQAHAPDESVSFDQVCLAARLYLELCVSLLPA